MSAEPSRYATAIIRMNMGIPASGVVVAFTGFEIQPLAPVVGPDGGIGAEVRFPQAQARAPQRDIEAIGAACERPFIAGCEGFRRRGRHVRRWGRNGTSVAEMVLQEAHSAPSLRHFRARRGGTAVRLKRGLRPPVMLAGQTFSRASRRSATLFAGTRACFVRSTQ